MTVPATPIASSKYPICRHIKTNGRRCQSPAVHRATYCHFHRTLHDAHTKGFPPPNALGFMPTEHIEKMLSYGEPLAELAKAFPSPSRMTLPPLEDAESVQVAISLIFSDMASGRVEHTRARSLLYALQLASYNFRTLAMIQAAHAAQPRTEDPMAHRVVRSRQGHTLAAPGDTCDSSALGAPAPSRRRKFARPEVAALPDPAPVIMPVDRTASQAENQPAFGKSIQPQSSESPWSSYVCGNRVESPSQSVPTTPQSDPEDTPREPSDPFAEFDLPCAARQPQPYQDFNCNHNGMSILASASSAKPFPSRHLLQESPRHGGGGPLNPHSAKAPHSSHAESRPFPPC